jgi:putative peptidoglycan lipid II flippase
MKPPPTVPPGDGGDGRDDGGQGSVQRRVAGAAGLMMAAILLSRVLGLVRDRVIAHQFGQGFDTDVYNGAFTIPDLMFFLIAGGALSGAFIPVFTEYVTTHREREAWRIFSVVAAVMTLVVSLFILVGEIYTRPLVILTNPGFTDIPGKVEATIRLTRILLPAQICFFLGGLMMGTLTARGIFIGQALGPVIYNLGIIFGGIFLTKYLGVAGLCWGAIAGAVIGNLAFQWVLVRRSGGYIVTQNLWQHWRHEGVIKVWKLMLPVILGLSLPQVSTIIGKIFASGLGDGPQSALMNANRLMQVPLGVFAQATAIAIFPTMSAQWARKELPALRRSVNFGIRSILFLTVPSSLLMFALAMPIVQLLLQSGKFTTSDAEVTAAALRFFAVGIFAWSAHAIITRGFYAMQDSRTPILVGTAVTLLFIPLNWVALRLTGTADPARAIGGLALVTSIAATIHMLSMLLLLRIRLRGIDGGRLLLSVGRILLASGLATLACWLTRNAVERRFATDAGAHVARQAAVTLVACLLVSTAVYGGLAFALKMEEMAPVRKIVRRLLGR